MAALLLMSYPHSRQEEGRKEKEELAVALSGEQRLSPKSLADFHLPVGQNCDKAAKSVWKNGYY